MPQHMALDRIGLDRDQLRDRAGEKRPRARIERHLGGFNQSANAHDPDTWIWSGARWQQAIGPPPRMSTPSPGSFTAAP